MVNCILSIRFCRKWELTTVAGCGGWGVPCPNSIDRQPCKQNEVNSNIIKEEYGNTETFLIFMGFSQCRSFGQYLSISIESDSCIIECRKYLYNQKLY